MIDLVYLGQNGDHLAPEKEQNSHCPFEFCECHPVLRPYMGRWIYVHQILDESTRLEQEELALIEQAEAIRQVVSIQLWREIEGKNVRHKILPFPQGFPGAVWPRPADKNAT